MFCIPNKDLFFRQDIYKIIQKSQGNLTVRKQCKDQCRLGFQKIQSSPPLKGNSVSNPSNFKKRGYPTNYRPNFVNADWAAFAMGVLIVFGKHLAWPFVIFLTLAVF